MSSTPKLSIITPVHNQAGYTASYLASHWAHMSNNDQIEWVIINNGSTDMTVVQLQQYQTLFKDRLKIITNTENLGFAIANNQGAALAQGDYLLLLNNDIRFSTDYTRMVIEALDQFPDHLHGPEYLTWDTGWNRFGDVLIEYIAAWCLAISKRVFFDLGGFDERYSPAYYEDMDLCFAAQKAGYPLRKADFPIAHISGQTGMHLPGREEITLGNKAKFAQKWGLED